MFTNRLGIELATQNAPPIKMKNLPNLDSYLVRYHMKPCSTIHQNILLL